MKILKQTAMAAAIIATFGVSTQASAGVEANIGATSNYIWRGVTQTNDDAAISGGLDYSHDSGFYLGTWASNVSWTEPDGYELDLYAGYGMEMGSIGMDFGAIAYLYPIGNADADFTEIYGNFSFAETFEAGVAFTIDKEAGGDENDLYIWGGAGFDLGNDLSLGLVVGNYDFDDSSTDDYMHYQVSLGKGAGDMGDFTFAVDDNDLNGDDGDPRVSISWAKTF